MSTGVDVYSTTPASNGTIGGTGYFPEGQAPSTVNDAARQVMADIAAWVGQAKVPIYVTGAAGTNTVTGGAPSAMAAYAVGQHFILIPANTNTGATTLNLTPSGASALGARNIFSNGVACVGGELQSGVPVVLVDDGTRYHIIGTLQVRGTFTATLTGVNAVVTGTANYSINGNVVTVNYPPMTGTSNTTACTLTGAPAAIRPTTGHNGFPIIIQDNSAAAAFGRADIETSGVVTLFVNASSATFTNVNVKGPVAGLTVTYNLN